MATASHGKRSVILRWAPFTVVLQKEVHLFACKSINKGQPVVLHRQAGGDYHSEPIDVEPGQYGDCQLVAGSDVHTTHPIIVTDDTPYIYLMVKTEGKPTEPYRRRSRSVPRSSGSSRSSSSYAEHLIHQIRLGDTEKITQEIMATSQQEHKQREQERLQHGERGGKASVSPPDHATTLHLDQTLVSSARLSSADNPGAGLLARTFQSGHKSRSYTPLRAAHGTRTAPAGSANSTPPLSVDGAAQLLSSQSSRTLPPQKSPHQATDPSAGLEHSPHTSSLSTLLPAPSKGSRHVRSRSADNTLTSELCLEPSSVLAPSFSRSPQPSRSRTAQTSSPISPIRQIPGMSNSVGVSPQLGTSSTHTLHSPVASTTTSATTSVAQPRAAPASSDAQSQNPGKRASSNASDVKPRHTVTIEALLSADGKEVPLASLFPNAGMESRQARPSSAPLSALKRRAPEPGDDFLWRPV